MNVPGLGTAAPLPKAAGFRRPGSDGIRVVITGKGGVGKTTIAALLSRLFARDGKRVLAVDGDPQQNLAVALGIDPKEADRIVPVSESAGYLREKTGAGRDLSPGGLLTLNPDVSDVIDRFSVPAGGHLRLLVMGGVRQAGSGCLCPEYTLLSAIFRHMRLAGDDVVVLDTSAGQEHFGRAVADGFTCAVIVADPSRNALSVARHSAALARQLGIRHRILAINRVMDPMDGQTLAGQAGSPEFSGGGILLPYDAAVAAAEPDVSPLLSGDGGFLRAARSLATMVTKPQDTCSLP